MLWLPFYLQDSLGLEPASAAYVSTMFDIGGGIGSPLCGIVADKLCRTWPLWCAMRPVSCAVRCVHCSCIVACATQVLSSCRFVRVSGGRRVFVAAIMSACAAVCIGLFSLLSPSDPLALNAALIFVIGLCIAAPDSVLGGVGVTDACEQAGAPEAVLSSASGLVVCA
jgi:sugar phosphate permease